MPWTQSAGLLVAALVVMARSGQAKVMVFGGGTLDEDNAAIWNKIVELAVELLAFGGGFKQYPDTLMATGLYEEKIIDVFLVTTSPKHSWIIWYPYKYRSDGHNLGGRGVARIGVITTGNAAPVTAGEKYTTLFRTYGAAEAYWVPVRETDPEMAYDAGVVAQVLTMTGFFYSGGNQPRVLGTLLTPSRADTPVMAAIRRRYNEGAVVAGSSGGALVQPGCFTVVAGWSYQALKYGPHKVGDNVGIKDLVYDDQGGLGFIKSHIVDAHFSERGREGRLIRLLADTKGMPLGTSYGFGVDENTILVVTDVDGVAPVGEVFGYHGVVFVDVSAAEIDLSKGDWQLRGAKLDYLTSGDVMSLSTHRATFGPTKTSIIGAESRRNAGTSANIFAGAEKGGRSEFRFVAESLLDAREDTVARARTWQSTPPYYVIMRQRVDTGAVRDVDGHFSYRDLDVDLRVLRDG